MEEIFAAWNFLKPHWPGISWLIVAGIVGRIMNKNVFTKAQAEMKRDKKWKEHFWWWGRRSLAVHPVAAGVLIGLSWPNPEGADPAWPTIGTCMYFAMFGAVSTSAYEIVKGLLKKRGIDIEPGTESMVPEASRVTPLPGGET